MEAIYHIIVIAVAVVGIARGWRLGFTGQVSGILGLGFGAVCAHVFAEQSQGVVLDLFPKLIERPGGEFICSFIAAATVYTAVYLLFSLLTGVLRAALQVFTVGLGDSMLGAMFCAFNYLMAVSVAYNVIVCIDPESPLMRYAVADDGNVVQEVMVIAPALIGSESTEEFGHELQMRKARSISRAGVRTRNFDAPRSVITCGAQAVRPRPRRIPDNMYKGSNIPDYHA